MMSRASLGFQVITTLCTLVINLPKNLNLKEKIAHGLLASGFISRLVGMYFDKRVLFLEQNLKFRKPVYLNDELLIKSEVLSKSSSTKIIGLKTNILNKTDILISGLTKLKYLL